MQKVIRVPKPVIEIVNSDYELRCDSSYYGINHYSTESSKSKKKIIQKLKDISQKSYNRNSRFVVIKLVATARCETEIKDYDKLSRRKFAVFDKNYNGIMEYHGVVFGVDRIDALKQLSSYNKKRLHLLKIANGKILRNKFYDMKVIDKTVLNKRYPDVRGTQQVLYDEIKGLPPSKNEFDNPVNEEELY